MESNNNKMLRKRKSPFEDSLFGVSSNGDQQQQAKRTNNNSKFSHSTRVKPQKWERCGCEPLTKTVLSIFRHSEATTGYYFHILGKKYAYVSEYQGRTVIHLRVYEDNEKTGGLIPTKTGCCLQTSEWTILREIVKEVADQLQNIAGEPDVIMRRALGSLSNWYVVLGTDSNGSPQVAIRLLLPTKRKQSLELCSTAKGLTFTEQEWKLLMRLLDPIDEAVVEIEESFVQQEYDTNYRLDY